MARGYTDEDEDKSKYDEGGEYKCLNCGHDGPAKQRGDHLECPVCRSEELEEMS